MVNRPKISSTSLITSTLYCHLVAKQTEVSICAHALWMRGGPDRQIADMSMKITTTAPPLESMNKERNFVFANEDRLDSWKEIACYLNRNVRTAQRWEAFESMPIHRHLHAKSGSVHAFRSELDAWRKERSYCSPPCHDQTRSTLRSEKGCINDKEQALLLTVLEAILVQLTTQRRKRPVRAVLTN